jgi:hypothetical protein
MPGTEKMESQLIQRLQQTLLRHKDRVGSWLKLAQAIEDANPGRDEARIDWRTLEKICTENGASVSLRISQLVAIEEYNLANNGQPIFAQDLSLIDALCESHTVNFLVAAKKSARRNDDVVAGNDLRAITRLMRTRLNRLQVRITDVTKPADWDETSPHVVNAAQIAVGSSVSNDASEALMRSMTGLSSHDQLSLKTLPFFIVGIERDAKRKSSFIYSKAEAVRAFPGTARKIDKNWRALFVNGKCYAGGPMVDYALLLAQRNPVNSQLRMVLCGLTSKSTLELARLLEMQAVSMPALKSGETHPPIMTRVFKLTLACDEESADGDACEVIGVTEINSPTFAHFSGSEWRFLGQDG